MKRKHSKTDTTVGKPKPVLRAAIYIRAESVSQLEKPLVIAVYPYTHG